MPKPIQRVRQRQTFSQASKTDVPDGSRAGVRYYCDRGEGSQVFTSKCKSCVKQHLHHMQHLRWRAAPMYASSRRSCWTTSASSITMSFQLTSARASVYSGLMSLSVMALLELSQGKG